MEGKDMNFNLNDMWRRIRCLASLRRMPQGQEVPDRIDVGYCLDNSSVEVPQ
jgi:hypothetical protein